jgi:hypothetical protein
MLIRNEAVCWACLEGFRDRRRDAERRRLAVQKPVQQRKGARVWRVLVRLGRRLVIWGRWLEERDARHASPFARVCRVGEDSETICSRGGQVP